MLPRHIAILKAKKGEYQALSKSHSDVARNVLPLFEIGRITESVRQRRYMSDTQTPTIVYLDRQLDGIFQAWGKRPAMVDCYQWDPSALTEDGSSVVAYAVSALRSMGMPIIPLVGYDRWESETYRAALQGIDSPPDGHFCIRLDTTAISDSAEPDFFSERVSEIIEVLDLDPAKCSVLIDFGDASSTSVDELVSKSNNLFELLSPFGFNHFITAACSIPKTIDLAVKKKDSFSMVLRKEMMLWQTLRTERQERILYGDYCVRGPTTNDEIKSKYTNGKIRHTIKGQTFVVRGHPYVDDHSAEQMHDLSAEIVNSRHFLGEAFSWGDGQISLCRNKKVMGGPTEWIAIDTNHHLAFVVQEVEEFERSRVKIAVRVR